MLNQQEKTVNIDNIAPDRLKGMMLSEEYFWLMTALAAACAEEELAGSVPVGMETKQIVDIFNKNVRTGAMAMQELIEIKETAWAKIQAIASFSNEHPIYTEKNCLLLSKAFVSYWLIFQLIQSEWQQKMDASELSDTYIFLDGLLADGEELEKIEEILNRREPLSADQKLYLRSNWQRVHTFWQNLYDEIILRLFTGEKSED